MGTDRLARKDIAELQTLLRKLGLLQGAADGNMGPATRSATSKGDGRVRGKGREASVSTSSTRTSTRWSPTTLERASATMRNRGSSGVFAREASMTSTGTTRS